MQDGEEGLGEIRKAWNLARNLDEDADLWPTLLDLKQQGYGWGQVKKACRLTDSETTPEQLLALHQGGIGWGQVKKAQALSDAGHAISLDEALDMAQDDLGWGQLRKQLGLSQGPPPWASGNRDREGHGKPPWANG